MPCAGRCGFREVQGAARTARRAEAGVSKEVLVKGEMVLAPAYWGAFFMRKTSAPRALYIPPTAFMQSPRWRRGGVGLAFRSPPRCLRLRHSRICIRDETIWVFRVGVSECVCAREAAGPHDAVRRCGACACGNISRHTSTAHARRTLPHRHPHQASVRFLLSLERRLSLPPARRAVVG